MAEIIYNDPWSPSDIKCDWKPEKLGRYSFVHNLINYKNPSNKLGYEQKDNNPTSNPETNLTHAITSISSEHKYLFRCINPNIKRGIKYICYYFPPSAQYGYIDKTTSNNGLFGEFIVPSGVVMLRITIYKEAWGYIKFYDAEDLDDNNNKDTNILNIVDNVAGTKIYEDLNFEVFVKQEAIIKNFVDKFNLAQFQNFTKDNNLGDNLVMYANSINYYDIKYPFSILPEFKLNHDYKAGDIIRVYREVYKTYDRYVCLENYTTTSESKFEDDLRADKWYLLSLYLDDFLEIEQNINEDNYNDNFPYIGYLRFKDLWNNDMLNNLDIFSRRSYFAISYNDFFAKNLREKLSLYDKFFDQGSIDADKTLNIGVKFVLGEDFLADDILGNTANKYFRVQEYYHDIPSAWKADSDGVNINNFNSQIEYPFDHYYLFNFNNNQNTATIPYFQEKNFKDCLIEIDLKKEDKLGNIYKRIIQLPIYLSFYNNLIKLYSRWNELKNTPIYTYSYYNYNNISMDVMLYSDSYNQEIVVWCPNVKNLTLTSTFLGNNRLTIFPKIVSFWGDNKDLDGEICILKWSVKGVNSLEKFKLIHILEYNDGFNYYKLRLTENGHAYYN